MSKNNSELYELLTAICNMSNHINRELKDLLAIIDAQSEEIELLKAQLIQLGQELKEGVSNVV